jgi:hypothetical protein
MSYVTDRYANFENDDRRYGIHTSPYLMNDIRATPRVESQWAFPGTLSSWKNVKSGNYNRRDCWRCQNATSPVAQGPGLYPLHPVPPASYPEIPIQYQKDANKQYEIYQKVRMCNSTSNSCGFPLPPGYSNYHDKTQFNIYPKQYIRGTWPDEMQDVTRAPDPFHTFGYNSPVIDCNERAPRYANQSCPR